MRRELIRIERVVEELSTRVAQLKVDLEVARRRENGEFVSPEWHYAGQILQAQADLATAKVEALADPADWWRR